MFMSAGNSRSGTGYSFSGRSWGQALTEGKTPEENYYVHQTKKGIVNPLDC
jgi:hypothetical protein